MTPAVLTAQGKHASADTPVAAPPIPASDRRMPLALAFSLGLHGLLLGGCLVVLAPQRSSPPRPPEIDLVGLIARRQVDVTPQAAPAAAAAVRAPAPAPAPVPVRAAASPVLVHAPPMPTAPAAAAATASAASVAQAETSAVPPSHVAPPPEPSPAEIARYTGPLMRALRAQLHYVRDADNQSSSFVVRLRFTVLASGELLPGSASVALGCGSAEYDARALKALIDAAPFPAPPGRLDNVTLDVRFAAS